METPPVPVNTPVHPSSNDPSDTSELVSESTQDAHPGEGLDERLEALSVRVDALQTVSEREHAPWYRRSSNILAALALVTSVVFSAITVFQAVGDSQREDTRELQQVMRSNLVEISEVSFEMVNLSREMTPNSLAFRDAMANLGLKRRMLLETARVTMDKLGEDVSPSMLFTLAYSLYLDQDFKDALELYRRALAMTRTSEDPPPIMVGSLHRATGQILMTPGSPVFDAEEGRRHLAQSVETFGDGEGQHSISSAAENLLFWAQIESWLGFTDRADSLYLLARFRAGELLESNPMRGNLIGMIDEAEAMATPASQATSMLAKHPRGLEGAWGVGARPEFLATWEGHVCIQPPDG